MRPLGSLFIFGEARAVYGVLPSRCGEREEGCRGWHNRFHLVKVGKGMRGGLLDFMV